MPFERSLERTITKERTSIVRWMRWKRHILVLGGLLSLYGRAAPPGWAAQADVTISVRPDAGVPPASITSSTASSTAVEGQLRLDWTAPTVFAGNTLDAYQLRIQTVSVASVGGSTTTWWNNSGGFLVQGLYSESPGNLVVRTLGPPGSDHSLGL